jgi:hypothetical protein
LQKQEECLGNERWISDEKEQEMNIYMKLNDLVLAAMLLVLMA